MIFFFFHFIYIQCSVGHAGHLLSICDKHLKLDDIHSLCAFICLSVC